jgi:glutathione S-transferase
VNDAADRVNRSPFTRRVAITLNAYGIPFEQRALSGFGNREEVRAANPLGRITARMPRLHALTARLAEEPPFRATEP